MPEADVVVDSTYWLNTTSLIFLYFATIVEAGVRVFGNPFRVVSW